MRQAILVTCGSQSKCAIRGARVYGAVDDVLMSSFLTSLAFYSLLCRRQTDERIVRFEPRLLPFVMLFQIISQ
jgi:hypothetical protein